MTTAQELETNLNGYMAAVGMKRMTRGEYEDIVGKDPASFQLFRMWCYDGRSTNFAEQVEKSIFEQYFGEEVISRVIGFYYDSVESIPGGNFYLVIYFRFSLEKGVNC